MTSSPDTRCCECETVDVGWIRGIATCKKCGLPINPIPAALERGAKIVPSPRTDWCGDCKMEHGYDCPKPQPECNCATARGIEWTCPVHGRMWREKEVAGWSKRFDEAWIDGEFAHPISDHSVPEKIKSFIAKVEAEAEARGRNAAVDYILHNSAEEIHGGRTTFEVDPDVFHQARQIPGV